MSAPAEIVIPCGPTLSRPRLSVLVPFHRHDPTALIERLAGGGAELVLLDDGSACANLLSTVMTAAEASALPTKIIVWGQNRGRSAARNRLVAEARGEYVLFLDADMIPDQNDFLERWLDLIQRQRPFIAFGGMSLQQATPSRDTALHHFLFARSDCRAAWARERSPARFVATSNLLVRRDVLRLAPFDDGFSGWGWEDVDWALRASRKAPIQHVDIPATHAGLDSVSTLLRKSSEAGPNYARMAIRHPEAAARFPSHRVAQLLKFMPARRALRELCAWLAREGAAPLLFRSYALKIFRASHYAEYLP